MTKIKDWDKGQHDNFVEHITDLGWVKNDYGVYNLLESTEVARIEIYSDKIKIDGSWISLEKSLYDRIRERFDEWVNLALQKSVRMKKDHDHAKKITGLGVQVEKSHSGASHYMFKLGKYNGRVAEGKIDFFTNRTDTLELTSPMQLQVFMKALQDIENLKEMDL